MKCIPMIGEIYIGQGKTHNAQYIGQVNKKNTARDKQHFYFHWSGVGKNETGVQPHEGQAVAVIDNFNTTKPFNGQDSSPGIGGPAKKIQAPGSQESA